MNYNKDYCYYHPKQFLVGVCPLCLNEKLLIVAAKKTRRSHLRPRLLRRKSHRESKKSDNNAGLQKIFALRSLLNRLEIRHRNKRRSVKDCDDIGSDYQSTSTSLEDSFISIKFEDNGVALWDKTKAKTNPSKTSKHQTNKPMHANKNHCIVTESDDDRKNTVVEHPKTPRGSLRWRKRIGHLLQLVRWKRSKEGRTSHVDGVGGVVNVRSKGWIRTFTSRRTSKE